MTSNPTPLARPTDRVRSGVFGGRYAAGRGSVPAAGSTPLGLVAGT
jgi:hypothetical protein